MYIENIYIALINNTDNVRFPAFNSVISLFNDTYPNNKLIIEKYISDGSIIQTNNILDDFISKYPFGKRVTISATTSIIVACSDYFEKNGMDVLNISLTATSNILQSKKNILTYAPFNQYAVMSNFFIYNDYQMKHIHVLYQQYTTNDLFLKDYFEQLEIQALLLNIPLSISYLSNGVNNYNIYPESMVIVLANTNDLLSQFITTEFIANFPQKSFIIFTDMNTNMTDILENIPAIVHMPTNINFTPLSSVVYNAVKHINGYDYAVYPLYDALFVLNHFSNNGLDITANNYISINPYGSNPEAWMLNTYLLPEISGAPYGKFEYIFTKNVIIGNNVNMFLQYYQGGQQQLPDSYSLFKIAGITPNNPSLIEYDDCDYYEIYDSNDNLVCVRYNSNITNFIDNLNIGTTIAARFIYNYNEDGYFTILHRLFPFDMEIPKVNPTMSKKPIKLKYIISQQTFINSVTISNNTIPENTQIGSFVGYLILVGINIGVNIKYELVSGNDSEDNIYFTMGASASNIYTNSTFNYRNKHEYSIRIKITYDSGYSVENSISLFIVIPVANNMNISTLINILKRITLNGKSVSGKELTYSFVQLPIYGKLFYISNGVYDYLPSSNNIDKIVYIVKENNMMSFPGTVIIHNYSQQDVANISKKQGSWYFQNITFDGITWNFGTLSATDFFQFSEYNILGSYTFYNNR